MKSVLKISHIILILTLTWDQSLFADTFQKINQNPSSYTLSLEQAKKIALENNPSLASAKERVVQATEKIKQARADYLPSISLSSSWDYTQETENSPSGYDKNQYLNKVSATQTLFDGFSRKYSNLSAKWGKKISIESRKDAQRLLIWSVAQSYHNVQLSKENIKIAESDIIFNQELKREAIAKQKAGTGSLSDVLNFKTRVNSAKSSLINANQEYRKTIYALAALLGYPDSQLPDKIKIEDLDGKSVRQSESMDLEQNLNKIVELRPDILENYYLVQDADTMIHVARSLFYPQVSLTGAYGNSGDWDSINDKDDLAASIGIKVSINLFSGGSSRSGVVQAQSEKRQQAKNLESAKILAFSEIRSAWDKIKSAEQQLVLLQENTLLVQETRSLVEKEYKAGQVSLVRLNQAQNDLVASLGSLAAAKVSLVLALEEFDYYTGKNILSI